MSFIIFSTIITNVINKKTMLMLLVKVLIVKEGFVQVGRVNTSPRMTLG